MEQKPCCFTVVKKLGKPSWYSMVIKGIQRQLTCKNLVPKVITFDPRYAVYSRDRLKSFKLIYARALSVILLKSIYFNVPAVV